MNRSGGSAEQAYRRGTLAGAAGRGIETACALAQLWLLMRILGSEQFGRFVFVMAIVQVLALIGSAGFERLTVFRLSRSDAVPGALRGGVFAGATMGWSVVVSTALAVAMWLAAPAAATVLGDPRIGGWLRGLCWLVPVIAAAECYAAWHLSRHRIAHAALLGKAVPAVLVTTGLAATAFAGWGAAGVVAAFVGGRAIAFAGWWLVHPVNPLRLWGTLTAADARYAAQTAATGLAHRAMRQADLLMLLPLAGPAVTASYAVVVRFAWLLRAGNELLSPIFTSRAGRLLHLGDRRAVEREFHMTRLWSTIVALLTAVPLVMFGPTILQHFGDAAAAYPVLLILLADQIAFTAFGMSGLLLMMAGRSGWLLASNLVMLGGNVALNWLLIPAFGAAGAATATLASVLLAKSMTALLLLRIERLATLRVDAACFVAIAMVAVLLAAPALLPPLVAAGVCLVVTGLLARELSPAFRSAIRRLAGPPSFQTQE